jgi:hypothetical protein
MMFDRTSKFLSSRYDRGYMMIRDFEQKHMKLNEDGSVQGGAIGVLVLLVTLILCALLFGTLQQQTDTKIAALNDVNATASYASIKATGWGSIDLFSMVPYVFVFVIILGTIGSLNRE